METRQNDRKLFLIRADINFEKWSVFTTRRQGSGRTLQRTNSQGLIQTVHVSPWVDNGKQYTLTASECKLMYVLYNIWQNASCALDKPIFFSFKQLADELGLKWSGEASKHIKRWLLNLRGVMIKFENCYKISKNDEIMKTTEMMTIISHLKIFERYKRNSQDPYFAYSEFQFHPLILQSLHSNFAKPLRLDVIRNFKSDIAVILYRWLDLMLFKQEMIERELKKLAKELGLEDLRYDNFVTQVRNAATELAGKELVTGKIGYCQVEPMSTGNGWKLAVKKIGNVNTGNSVWFEEQALAEQERIEQTELKEYYLLLPQPEQYKIEEESQRFIREKYHNDTTNLTKELALYDAIKSYKEEGENDGRFQAGIDDR